MASRYGWPIALSLAAVATVSIPARPNARQVRAEHRRAPGLDIRDNGPAQVLDRPGLTGGTSAVSSTLGKVGAAGAGQRSRTRAKRTTKLRGSYR